MRSFVNIGFSEGTSESHALSYEIDLPDLVFDNAEFTMIEQCSRLYPMVQPERFVMKARAFPLRFNKIKLVDIQRLPYLPHRWVGAALATRACLGRTDALFRELRMRPTPAYPHSRTPWRTGALSLLTAQASPLPACARILRIKFAQLVPAITNAQSRGKTSIPSRK